MGWLGRRHLRHWRLDGRHTAVPIGAGLDWELARRSGVTDLGMDLSRLASDDIVDHVDLGE